MSVGSVPFAARLASLADRAAIAAPSIPTIRTDTLRPSPASFRADALQVERDQANTRFPA